MSRKFLTPIVLPGNPSAALEAAPKQYVDLMNEVWIGPSDPGAAFELWVDDDATGPVVPMPAYMPRGWITTATLATDVTGITSAGSDLTGLTVAWIAEASRRYQIVLEIGAADQGVAAALQNTTIADAANVVKRSQSMYQPVNGRGSYHLIVMEIGLTGSQTRKARFSTSAGTANVSGVSGSPTYAAQLHVFDVGGT